ncbi:MAG TPA: GTPase HflX [Candidatus Dormibacteraeota bacterium]|nr:GTPase HflX [Candidatus Dormibacteraeota bacterium]
MRAVIAELKLPAFPSLAAETRMMAESIGYEVVGTLIQKRKSVHHSYTIGPGRLKDLKSLLEDERADTVIFANPLTSSHVFNLTQHLGGDVRVIDRNLLILEVFDKRAFTNEAKLQIRLAKLKYTLSWGREFIKLRGIMGEQLGWMGPGDYPYHEYYRAARNRISRIEHELEDIYKKKMLKRDRRRELGFPIVALAGYTQAGKTSFFNLVAHEEKSVGLGPFTTLTTFARKATTGSAERGSEFIIIDSIGFIEDMHPTILKAFHATLGELATADLVLLFVDASDEPFPLERKVRSCSQILREVDATSPIIICANKVDKVSEEQFEESKAIIRKYFLNEEIVPISVKTGQALDMLLATIWKQLQSLRIIVKQRTRPTPD